ncbi:S-layer protein sap precursor [Bacillus paranthracis]|uniref:S-layer protein sap n=1 Tax=Bacillus paranthracis TaxID=2026186 RepID=A0A7D8D798_9BACI|nr:S-layer homology domain-containing protein [Bacillus paranthracis]SMD59643.1 S-layer protein sap precursor [Bacillus paranthracis]
MANKFLKTATALTIMGTSLLGAGAFTAKADNTDSLKFNDVPANHWSTKAIYDLTNRKVVQGYGNNIFGFGDNVTRGQVARMIYMYVKPVDADASFKNPFTDIKGHLFEKEIRALAKAGLVNGFGDGKYGPDDILTREQMAQVLKNAFKFKATKTTKFADVDKNSWSYDAISALEENGVTIGTGGNMYSPKMFVTREAYSQFLFNSINAVEKEEKPEVKPDPKPETNTEEKPEVKPDPKPETNLPSSIDKGLVTEEVTYNPNAMKNPIAQKSISTEAQNLIKSVNAKFGTNLKYADLNGTIRIIDKNMYLPEGTIGAQVYVNATSENDFKIIFLDNNEATIELAKKWTTMLNSDLVLDKEIQETVDAQEINNYEKGKYKIRVGHSTADHMMYIQVRV